VLLTGQDGWYLPVTNPVSADYKVFTYAGNTLGFVQNPQGGEQFTGGSNAGTSLARGQHTVDFSTSDTWTITFDWAATFDGVLPALNNVGSFSLQPSVGSKYFQTLYAWDNVATGSAVDAQYLWWNAAGVQQAFTIPGPEWDALPLNTWFRQTTEINWATNQIVSASIENLHTGAKATVDTAALGWYMTGGQNPTLPLPTDVRLFTGGGAANINTMGFDNLSVVHSAAVCYPDCDENGVLDIDDFVCFQTFFAFGSDYADCDGNGVKDVDDFICFQTFFAIGCP
jgi:hypothetical protein